MEQVIGVDIGSVASGKFAWAALDMRSSSVVEHGDSPEGAAQALISAVDDYGHAALVMEAPGAIPVPGTANSDSWRLLGREREGEHGRPWSAGAGCAVLATGLAQTAWMLQRFSGVHAAFPTSTQPERYVPQGSARLLLGEAFVSGDCKPVPGELGPHCADAEAAARAVAEYLNAPSAPDRGTTLTCAPQGALNVLAAAGLWAGLEIDPDEIRMDVLAVRAPRTVPPV